MFQKPMLAHTYKPEKHDRYEFGREVFLQPKFDGVRAIFDGNVFWSRQGNPLPVPVEIRQEAKRVIGGFGGLLLDGEIYIHGMSFQNIQSVLKNKSNPKEKDRLRLRYMVYDVINLNNILQNFTIRFQMLRRMLARPGQLNSPVVLAQTALSPSGPDSLLFARKGFEAKGYEGLIIRTIDGKYAHKRSKSLLKYKSFQEDDFVITDVREGKGKNEGTAVFTCRTERGYTFDVTAPGDYQDKTECWRDRHLYIGKMITVKFQELTDDGIPRFPVALGFKEDR